jgi:hypothetical protein
MNADQTPRKGRRWLYPIVYVLFVLINVIPPYAEKPFAPQETQDVIINLLMVSTNAYRALGPIFHIGTVLMVVLIAASNLQRRMGRVLAAYMGVNYLVIACVQTMGSTEKFGFVIYSGALILSLILGITWIVVAFRGELGTSFRDVPVHRYLLVPLALLAFWAPYDAEVRPYFNPLLLLTSADYGLTFCFTTPVFVFLLVLFYPKVNAFAYRITAFNGFLYGLLNVSHFFNPELRWMGVLHLPLLIISLYALILPTIWRRRGQPQEVGG